MIFIQQILLECFDKENIWPKIFTYVAKSSQKLLLLSLLSSLFRRKFPYYFSPLFFGYRHELHCLLMYTDIECKVSLYPLGFVVPQKYLPFEMVILFSMNILGHKQNNDFQNIMVFFSYPLCLIVIMLDKNLQVSKYDELPAFKRLVPVLVELMLHIWLCSLRYM